MQKPNGPFSFFGLIFIHPDSINENELDEVLTHGGPGGMSLTSEDMIKKLELTDDQVTKLKTEEQAFKKKMEANRPDRSSMNSEKSTKSSSDEKANKPGKGGQMDTMMKEHGRQSGCFRKTKDGPTAVRLISWNA